MLAIVTMQVSADMKLEAMPWYSKVLMAKSLELKETFALVVLCMVGSTTSLLMTPT